MTGLLGKSVTPEIQAYAWDRSVKCKIGALLNKLTERTFDSISDQVILYANLCGSQNTGSTLLLVAQAIFHQATTEEMFSDLYARLCRKMMDNFSPETIDSTGCNDMGGPISNGTEFQKHLFALYQSHFEQWFDRSFAGRGTTQQAELYPDAQHIGVKPRRQELGVTRFMGELIKSGVLEERVLHQCITKLLWSTDDTTLLLDTAVPKEGMVETVCMLLATVGRYLDHDQAHSHMDVYFRRIRGLTKCGDIGIRARCVLEVSGSAVVSFCYV